VRFALSFQMEVTTVKADTARVADAKALQVASATQRRQQGIRILTVLTTSHVTRHPRHVSSLLDQFVQVIMLASLPACMEDIKTTLPLGK
jgi:hypothetical protein